MLLCVDIGNSNIVLGCYGDDNIVFCSRISSDKSRLGDQYAVEIKDILLLYGIELSLIKNAIVSSVVPALTEPFVHSIEVIFGFQPLVVSPGLKTGLNIKIDDPAQLGSDFVAGAVAAKHKYPLPIIVIDMGTATTFSIISKAGDFLGGAIMPGLRVATEALVNKTSLLIQISYDAPKNPLGTNTSDSMKSGAIFGTASMIDGMCRKYFKELGETATIVATGGLAASVIPFCECEIIHDDLLLLDGLKLIFDKNSNHGK